LTNIRKCDYVHRMSQVDEDHASPPLLEMRGIVKVFPGVRALDGVDLQVRAGEVHCLLGQNGAGKSTLIKVLSGAHTVDAGEVLWRGEPASLASPVAALKQGIATIYQELDLVDWLSVGEGLLTFNDPDSALNCIERVNANYELQQRAARKLAEEHFATQKVLPRLLEAAMD